MWLLSGPFDGNEGDINFEKLKLLKPGKRYILGRRDTDLVVNNKKVSREHATFTLGSYSIDNAADPSTRPSVQLHNPRSRPMIFEREGKTLQVDSSSTIEMQDGDVLRPFNMLSLKLKWHRLCCYMSEPKGSTLEDCASLGINFVHTSHPDSTHHVTSILSLEPSITLSLVSGSLFVTPEWLEQIISMGESSGRAAPLELDFKLPPTSKFWPRLDPSLPSSLKFDRLWEHNDDRLRLFSGYRFLLLTRTGEQHVTPQCPLLELFSRTGGHLTICQTEADFSTFRSILSKNKAEKSLIIVTDEAVKNTTEEDIWNGLREDAQNFGCHNISRKQVLEAAINMDVSLLSAPKKSISETCMSPDVARIVSNEQSSLPGRSRLLTHTGSDRKSLVRRATSSASQALSPAVTHERERSPPSPVQRPLMRRAGTAMKVPISVDNSTTIDTGFSVPAVEESSPLSNKPILGVDFDAPVVPRSSRLKRRAGTTGASTLTMNTNETTGVEPPLKKFRALFEESDPNRLSQTGSGVLIGTGLQPLLTQIQSLPPAETQIRQELPVPSVLHTVEQDEESTMSSQADIQACGLKRRSDRLEDGQDYENIAGRPTKRRILNDTRRDAHLQQPNHSQQSLAAPVSQKRSQTVSSPEFLPPDVDEKFMKAIASIRKGKKNEDTFDREFNDLRISKPDLQRDDREKVWSVLEDFGDERNIRGNFMVVVEMEVFKKDTDQAVARQGTGRANWEGKPDFKKFHKKHLFEERPIIELTVSEGNDYGLGSVYWKENSENRSQPTDRTFGEYPTFPVKSQTQGKHKALAVPTEDSEEDEDDLAVRPTRKSTPGPQKGTQTKGRMARTKEEKPFQPLFLGSDDEKMAVDDDAEIDELDAGTPTLRSTNSSKIQKSQNANQRKNAPAAVIIDDDSDDEATFKGFGAKVKGRSRR